MVSIREDCTLRHLVTIAAFINTMAAQPAQRNGCGGCLRCRRI